MIEASNLLGSSYDDNMNADGCFAIQAHMHLYRSISDNDISSLDGSNSREESASNGEDEPMYQKTGVRVHGGAQKVCMKDGDESSKSRQTPVPYLVVLQYDSMDTNTVDNINSNNNNNAEQLDAESSSGVVSYRMVVDIHVCTLVTSLARNGTNATDAYFFIWSQTRFVRGLRKMLHVDLKSMEPERVRTIASKAGQQLARQRGAAVEMCLRQLCKNDHAIINCSNIIIPGDDDGIENEGNRGACLAAHHRGWISYAGIGLSLATVMANVLLEWRSRASIMSRSKKHSVHDIDDSSNNNNEDKGSETNAEWQRTKMGRLKRGGSMGKMAYAHKSVQPWQS